MSRRIGRFEVRGELGRGAQSVVYLGFDPQLQRDWQWTEKYPAQPEILRYAGVEQSVRLFICHEPAVGV